MLGEMGILCSVESKKWFLIKFVEMKSKSFRIFFFFLILKLKMETKKFSECNKFMMGFVPNFNEILAVFLVFVVELIVF